jgi:hypothetical protein
MLGSSMADVLADWFADGPRARPRDAIVPILQSDSKEARVSKPAVFPGVWWLRPISCFPPRRVREHDRLVVSDLSLAG